MAINGCQPASEGEKLGIASSFSTQAQTSGHGPPVHEGQDSAAQPGEKDCTCGSIIHPSSAPRAPSNVTQADGDSNVSSKFTKTISIVPGQSDIHVCSSGACSFSCF
jgi:hypothetical protein